MTYIAQDLAARSQIPGTACALHGHLLARTEAGDVRHGRGSHGRLHSSPFMKSSAQTSLHRGRSSEPYRS